MRFHGFWTGLGALWLGLALSFGAQAASRTEFRQSAAIPVLERPIPYAIYIPDDAPKTGERWPVVYLLHGLTGRDGDWFTWGNLATILDRLIASDAIQPMVVVAPGAGDSLVCRQSRSHGPRPHGNRAEHGSDRVHRRAAADRRVSGGACGRRAVDGRLWRAVPGRCATPICSTRPLSSPARSRSR